MRWVDTSASHPPRASPAVRTCASAMRAKSSWLQANVRLGDGARGVPVAPFDGVEQLGVLESALPLLLGEELEVIARHDADGLA